MTVDVPNLLYALQKRRYRFTTEAVLQEGIAKALERDGFPFEREVDLGGGSRIDFMVGGEVGVEVKIGGSTAAVTAQLHRYAQCERVRVLVLVTSKLVVANLPGTFNGKSLYVVALPVGLM